MGSSLTSNDCDGGANSRRDYNDAGGNGSSRDCGGATSPLRPSIHLTNTLQISICPHCGLMTFILMDDDGNRYCGKCKEKKDV